MQHDKFKNTLMISSNKQKGTNMNCLECGCPFIREYKCPHDCDWCKDYDPEQEEDEN